MENKQTAVEWLDRWFRDNPEATYEEGNKALQQAKQMEKEQIETAYNAGREYGCTHDCAETGEDYYNLNYTETNDTHPRRIFED